MLTITVLTFNGENLLEDCLRSIDKQILRMYYKKIVVDNGSHKPVKNIPGWQIHRVKKNEGHVKGINECFRVAEPGQVLFVSNDVRFLENNCIHNLYSTSRLHGGQIQPMLMKTDGSIDNCGMDYKWPGYGIGRLKWVSRDTQIVPNITFMMHKTIWARHKFDENIKMGYEDVDFGLRYDGNKLVVKESRAIHLGNQTIKKTIKDQNKEFDKSRLYVINKNFRGLDRFARANAVRTLATINRGVRFLCS